MSKHFNNFVIEQLENQQTETEPECNELIPPGDVYLLFISEYPDSKISQFVVEKTVQKICFDANLGNRFSVRIETGKKCLDYSEGQLTDPIELPTDEYMEQHSKPSVGSGDENASDDSIEIQPLIMEPEPSPSSDLLELYNASDVFSTDSDSFTASSMDSINTEDSLMCTQLYPRNSVHFRTSAYIMKIMRKLRTAAKNYVLRSFGRYTPSEHYDEELLTPTLFGPSIDEPFATLFDHIYHVVCWLVDSEQANQLNHQVRPPMELPNLQFDDRTSSTLSI